ncbi:ABC transporter substrate-binding protein [Ideonella sp. BN130291]|uniref:ABC transporter substrate-binding protein n=1 Tax=Ideonella sp. BN130291 TaxID=3112940 RepID=UPI002E2739B1|nr:extracellular solute-binding protein [Ideonella sp. BN130291]
MTIRRWAAALLAAWGVALAMPQALAQPAPITLTVATFPDLDRSAKAALAQWAKERPDVQVKIASLQYADHHTAMTTVLATGSGVPDVMALDFRFIAKFTESGGLTDLSQPPFNGLQLKSLFVPFAFAQGINSHGALAAIPTDIGPGTLLYRKDLLDRAGVSEAELTASWESYIAAGRRIKAATGAYLLADAADVRDILIRSGVQPGEGLYFDDAGKVLVDSPRFVRAFEIGRAVRLGRLDAKAVAWSNEWTAGFKHDRIATQMMGAWLAGHLKNWLAPHSAGQWRSALLPGGQVASYGGSFYAIPRLASHKQAAWDFIRFLTTRKDVQLNSLKVMDAFPALLAAQDDPMMDEPLPFLGGQRARLLWRDIARQVPPIPVNRNDSMATDVIRSEFEQVVSEGKDIRQALADARRLLERRTRR